MAGATACRDEGAQFMFRINNNVAALQSQRHLQRTSRDTIGAIERLSSGLRVNKAADDAATMFISEQMRSQIAAFKQGNRNVAQASTLLQVMEGGLDKLTGILTRLKELAMQAADGSYSDAQRLKGIQVEGDELVEELDRVVRGITFNGITLFPDVATSITFAVGEYNQDRINLGLQPISSGSLLGTVFGGMFNTTGIQAMVSMPLIVDGFMAQIQSGIDTVISQRARLGAVQNRLERTSEAIMIQIENTTNADSVIRDADMAAETSALVRAQILAQSGTAVLNQANLLSQNALNLLSSLG
jgi:flagellin